MNKKKKKGKIREVERFLWPSWKINHVFEKLRLCRVLHSLDLMFFILLFTPFFSGSLNVGKCLW